MPLKLSRGDRKIVLIAGGVFLLIIIVSFIFAKAQAPARRFQVLTRPHRAGEGCLSSTESIRGTTCNAGKTR